MGLKARIAQAQKRKAAQVSIEQASGNVVLAKAIVASKDGGLLAHVKAEAAR